MPDTNSLAASAPVVLPNLAVIRVSGPDRESFLQGQLTQDMRNLAQDGSLLAGWTSAKGRLMLVTQMFQWHDAVWLPVHADLADSVVRRLRMFVLRAAVSLDIADAQVFGTFSDTALPDEIKEPDGLPVESGACRASNLVCAARLIGDPARSVMLVDRQSPLFSTRPDAEQQGAWTRANIRAGIPSIYAATSEAFVPQMVNLDILHGISFTKGCYVGQEIVARTQNLGRIKRRMLRLVCDSSPSLDPGTLIYGPEGTTGRVVSSVSHSGETELLAVIPLSHQADTFYADEAATLRLRRMPLPYELPELAAT
jgi:folate-binding protein YgfZ